MARTKQKPAQRTYDEFQEIGRTTLGTANAQITVNFPARKYLRVKYALLPNGAALNPMVRYNGDSGANYSSRLSANGGADSQPVNQNQNYLDAAGSATQVMWGTYDILNIANQEKISIGQTTANPTGTGVTPNRREQIQKWVNTSTQITSLTADAFSGANTFAVGSEVIVYGHD